MTTSLTSATRAAAEGICTLGGDTGLVIARGTWLARDDGARFAHHDADAAAIDREAAVAALDAGGVACSGGAGESCG